MQLQVLQIHRVYTGGFISAYFVQGVFYGAIGPRDSVNAGDNSTIKSAKKYMTT